mmetsp:Transcript_14803/g.35790  ORF Transcript_14803/g.35790 Transcript_14803/m.35790 type:complete len:747 (+) Transcript_14803:2306-4546(+)
MDEQRSSSFNNLAAVFGSGLAESINDAVLTDSFFASADKKQGDLNYARQSRQTALRMGRGAGDSIGASHKAPEAGNLFASFDAPNHRATSVPKYGGGGGGGGGSGGRGPSGRDDYSRGQDQSVPGLYTDHGYGTAFAKDRSTHQGGGGNYMKDLGMTVTEPQESRGRPRPDDGTMDLQRGMQNLWSSSDDQQPKGGAAPKDAREIQREAEDDMRPFAWDVRHHEASRTLVIMRASALSAADVRAACELFGVIDAFRSDFADRGIFFVSYYDMRCSEYAAMELLPKLQRPGANGDKLLVQFCVPLNSSSQFDDSLVVLTDVPMDMNIESLAQMLSSYGAVRSLRSLGGNYGGTSFVAEYHDVQDAKQAVLELESTQPWGPNVSVEIGARNPSDRKRGRELLALIGRWRHGESSPDPSRRHPSAHGGHAAAHAGAGRYAGHHDQHSHTNYIPSSHAPRHDIRYDRGGGPDRGYGQNYVVVNNSGYPQPYNSIPPYHGDHHSNHQQSYMGHHGGPPSHQHYGGPPSHGRRYHFSSGGSVVSANSAYSDGHHSAGHYPSSSRSVPAYYPADGASVGSQSRDYRSVPGGSGTPNEKDNRHLKLDVDSVENGRDSRTSLMVRNIPNKYTQQMLLSEFAENGHGPGTIDFFYLPIDFKNKCNRGYAFINFVDFRDILPFHRRYYGKHWRTFNSDKICEITYARIQGKSAMLKRFENSALMEKDEEYKPLVFVSNGPDRGKSLPFPDPSNRSSS